MVENVVGCQDEWEGIVAAGDAVGLVAIFREAAVAAAASASTRDNSALTFTYTFLESHVFASSLQVDLSRFLSAASSDYGKSVLDLISQHTLDPREVLIELLAIRQLGNERAVAVYLRLLQATLRQLFFDTLRRKTTCTDVKDSLLRTHATMSAWYAEVEERVSYIMQTFCRRDALPTMVRTENKFNEAQIASHEDSEEEGDDSDPSIQIAEDGTLEVLVALVLDLAKMLGSSEKTVSLLLMVRAIEVASQPYNSDARFLHKLGSDLRHWSNALFRVGDVQKRNCQEKNLATSKRLSETDTVERNQKTSALRETLFASILPCGICPWLLRYSSSGFLRESMMNSFTYEDNERGKDASDAKALVFLHEFKKEKDFLQIISDDDSDGEVNNNYNHLSFGALSLQKIGVMLTIFDVITRGESSHSSLCFALISNSPTTLLFWSTPVVLDSLKSCSLGVVMCGLAFLFTVLPHVPAYNVYARGELDAKAAQMHNDGAGDKSSFGFRTRRFELMFELAKALVCISATCPSKDHREVARAVFMLLLQRFAADLRMLMYSSFLVLTPFASICSLMLHSLRSEWKDDVQMSRNSCELRFFCTTLPRCLLQAQENWLRRLRVGEVAFVDPLIQSINFVRFLIAEDRRRGLREALFQLDASGSKVQLCKDVSDGEEGDCDCWDKYFARFLKNIVPQLRAAVAGTSEASATETKGLFSGGITLSDLDCFALGASLDGLLEQVTGTV